MEDDFWKQMSRTGDLSLLNSVQFCQGMNGYGGPTYGDVPTMEALSQSQALPSWAPGWEKIYRPTLVPWSMGDIFEVSKGMPLALSASQHDGLQSLILEGIEVGRIVLLTSASRITKSPQKLVALKRFTTSHNGLCVLAQTLVAGKEEHGFVTVDRDQTVADFAARMLNMPDQTKSTRVACYWRVD
jgi:hypothetical protein